MSTTLTDTYLIHQFYDTALAHGSYAIVSQGEMVLIDPARNPQPYYDFAAEHQARLVAVIETHPHADFVSSHAEISRKTGAAVYVSKLYGALYPHQTFDAGDSLKLGSVVLKALNTPGHSPDSISILLEDEEGRSVALFSGDTLFVGDVGRPDLREKAGNLQAAREELAKAMYGTVSQVLRPLADETLVYPAHGPGSLCGKSMGPDLSSSIGREKAENYAFQLHEERLFVEKLLEDQPFVPRYFGYDVELNRAGAPDYQASVDSVPVLGVIAQPQGLTVVDTRSPAAFKKGHWAGALNIPDGGKFETWLGSIINPHEPWLLLVEPGQEARMLDKVAKIGYEAFLKGVIHPSADMTLTSDMIPADNLRHQGDSLTIVDLRNVGEVKSGKKFAQALTIPLPELRERYTEIPTNKPIVVHCAAGYRSAVGQSVLQAVLPGATILDLGEAITQF